MIITAQAKILRTLHDSLGYGIFASAEFVSISTDCSTSVKNMKLKSITNLTLAVAAMLLAGCSKAENAADTADGALLSQDFKTAAEVADSSIAAAGASKQLYRTKGIALLGQGEYDKAADAFISALSCSNGIIEAADIDISYYLAVAEYKNGDLESALSTANAICDIRPKDDGAYFLRGKISLAMSDKDSALADFDRTVKLAPDNCNRYVGIYEELHACGYDAEAAGYLEKAMSEGSRLSDYNKGVLEFYLGSYTDARSDLENARKKDANENLILYLGRTYEALGDDGYAMTLYEDYIRQNSSAGRIYEQLTDCQMKKGDYETALSTIETGLSLGGGEGQKGMMFDRMVALEMLYRFDEAKKSADEYLALYPDDEVAKRENVFLSSR